MANYRYFRNKRQVKDIEPDTVWRLEGDRMVMHDDDEYEFVMYNEHRDDFYEVDPRNSFKPLHTDET